MQPAHRIASIPPYFFARLGKTIAELRAQGVDVIRMDMGSPDMPPAPHIIEALVQTARRPDSHGYTPFGGTPEYRRAVATYYRARFGVELDPDTEVVGLIGSKEGIFHLTQAFVNPGDVVLAPDPGYPTYRTTANIAGGEIVSLPLRPENGFLPDLGSLPEETLRRTRLLWLNYPNNPTGATADLDFFRQAVEIARRYDILVCHDAPYLEISFDGYRPPSLLQVEGAKEVAVELNSLSKTYNMAGWRLGMAVGNAETLRALYTLKSQVDSSHFRAVLEAGAVALTGDQAWLEARNAVYQERRDLVLEGFRAVGMAAEEPRAAMYVWAALPAGETSSLEFTQRMLREIGVSVTPGVAFGERGEGFVRVSLGTPTDRVREAMDRLVRWLG